MPLFRFHRGGLRDSLDTTVIVHDLDGMVRTIVSSDLVKNNKRHWSADFKVIPYPKEGENFDSRIGWYTHIVLANIFEEDKMDVVGFLSEPI